MKSWVDWLKSVPPDEAEAEIRALSPNALLALPYLFDLWALNHQLPPTGDWKTWVVMGGRGSGKTRAGAEWVRRQVEGPTPDAPGRCRRIALVAETLGQAREVMVFGESGILACCPDDRRPVWQATRRQLVWPNGAVAQIFSAHSPESLRGPQFDGAWLDELAKWRRAAATWDQLQFALRLGDNPQQVVTTTPKNLAVLKEILDADSTVMTQAPTQANRAFLARSFLTEVETRYAGTRLGMQELDGILSETVEGALWSPAVIEDMRSPQPEKLSRIVVAVDPPVSGHAKSDACGIVVVGALTEGPPRDWRAWVLEDATVEAAHPSVWAKAVIAAMRRHNAHRVVAEVNQGGALVESMLRMEDPLMPYRGVHATDNKVLRAEPVAALYEQGRVHHLRGLGRLEDQMCKMTVTGFQGRGSPDRVDALVWALTELIIEPASLWREPRVRRL